MKKPSLDPRFNRIDLPENPEEFETAKELDQWQTFEVFQQETRGSQHVHVGIVHAPSPELAIVMAKEQYARRGKCVNLWVVRTADVFATEYEDQDLFEPATDKNYREMYGYKNTRQQIKSWLAEKGQTPVLPDVEDEIEKSNLTEKKPATVAQSPKSKIIIGKKS